MKCNHGTVCVSVDCGTKWNVPECKSRAVPISEPVESFSLLCPARLDWAAPHRNLVEADAHRIHLKSPLLCRHAMRLNRQRHAFHFVHDAMNSCRQVFAAPSMWMPVARTDARVMVVCIWLFFFSIFFLFASVYPKRIEIRQWTCWVNWWWWHSRRRRRKNEKRPSYKNDDDNRSRSSN